MSSRREPLLWLQCLALGAIPLELLVLRLVLAGSDLGPLPALERLLTWGIGALAPAFLLWRRSPDWGSLLLLRLPLADRTKRQRQLSAAQTTLPLKLLGSAGVVPLLLLLWWIDASALLVADLSPLQHGSRLGSLLIAAPLLALLLWQWHQLIQASWLLTRDNDALDRLTPLSEAELQQTTLSLGLSLLRLPDLDWGPEVAADSQPKAPTTPPAASSDERSAVESTPTTTTATTTIDANDADVSDVDVSDADASDVDATAADTSGGTTDDRQTPEIPSAGQQESDDNVEETAGQDQALKDSEAEDQHQHQPEDVSEKLDTPTTISEDLSATRSTPAPDSNDTPAAGAVASDPGLAVLGAIEPEQPSEGHDGPDLDSEVGEHDTVASADAKTHHEQAEATGGEESDPEQPAQPSPGSA